MQKTNITKRLGDLLIKAGRITPEQLKLGIGAHRQSGERFGETLVRLGLVTEVDIAHTLSDQLGIPYTDMETAVVEPMAVHIVPESLATRYSVMPLGMDGGRLAIAMADPLDVDAIKEVEFASGHKVKPTASTPRDIARAIRRHYHLSEPVGEIVDEMLPGHVEVVYENIDDSEDLVQAARKSSAAPIVRIVNRIISNAVNGGASDVHIEPRARHVVVRERVDGIMRDACRLPKWVQGAVTSRLKVIGMLDIAEKRVPQDGRVRVRVADREVDLRISVLPVQYGESVVIRVIDTQAGVMNLTSLGTSDRDYARIRDLIERPQGMVLVTGPTGSGKTCTLYAMIEHIKDDSINIISLENPVEYEIEGVKQVAVNDKTGLTFARGLRSVLRQDPDVIMVGEMRDRETVEIALQASLTGHLVLSTLHTNTTVGAVTRLRNMGVPSYLIASSLNGVVAQRLARRICRDCKAPYVPDPDELARLGLKEALAPGLEFYRGSGCSRCGDTGYRGRIGVFEILTCGPAMRQEITADAHEESLARTAIGSGMRYMSQDGLDKALKGETTIEEILRVLNVERETGMLLCGDCGGHLRPGFLACPYCGASVVNGCPCCGTPREPEWKFCPYCVGKTA